MQDAHGLDANSERPMSYQIRVKGLLDRHWAHWFEGLEISPGDDGETVLTGLVADQAALHSLLRKVRDLGMPLLSVSRVGGCQMEAPGSSETPHDPSQVR